MPVRIRIRSSRTLAWCLPATAAFCVAALTAAAAAPAPTKRPAPATPRKQPALDFDRDVRPILAENCFACHGPDSNKRQAGLRLDVPEGPFTQLATGHAVVVRGKPDESMLIRRVSTRTMPPPSFGKKLTDAQIETLRRWVKAGAPYEPHWSFVKPRRPGLPEVHLKGWVKNPIDRFILARLEQEGLHPSPAADRATLIRRVSLDLTGLPPTLEEIDAFLKDTRPDAYERVVDRLLASPHYGERMALQWLDLARYADTHGYHIDSQRDMWRWRDWVIDAYNRNEPYDKFTIDQIAGDLLPHATMEQRLATGFNRNHPIDFEGGAIPEEYAAAYIFDRIDTTATTFMGLTLRCCQCHDHKYDPLTQRDFYRFYAFFNNVPEQGLDGQKGNAVPYMKAPLPGQQERLAAANAQVAKAEAAVKARAAEAAGPAAEWARTAAASLVKQPAITTGLAAHYALDEGSGDTIRGDAGGEPAGHVEGKAAWSDGRLGKALAFDGATFVNLGTDLRFERSDAFSYGAWVYLENGEASTVISRMDDAQGFRGWDLYLSGGTAFVHMIHEWEKDAIRVNTKTPIPLKQWHHLFVTYDGSSKAKGIRIYVDGKPVELDVTHDHLTGSIVASQPVRIGRRSAAAPFHGMMTDVRVYRRQLSAAEVAQLSAYDTLRPVLALAPERRTPAQKEALTRYYLETQDAPYRKLEADAAEARRKRDEIDAAIPTSMVMEEMPKPRDTFMLIRGQYDRKGEKVTAGVPAVLPPLPPGAPANRLGLAEWIVSPENPLTARVAVNRYWQMYFGTGLVATAENFGTQGDRPSHPKLLDWLATEFIRTGWDVKAMQRLIVTSATYRQSSRGTPLEKEKDPENRLLSRGPRQRLPAELIRDQALAISGLLVDRLGGPSVKPYQPAGLWEEISFGAGFSAQTYVQDHGEALYRRSMYTFWKRTVPPPALQVFDAPSREVCEVRRSVTNTPLQALVLMNDPTYVEASRKLAERMMGASQDPAERLAYAFRLATAHPPTAAQRQVLLGVYYSQLGRFRRDPDAAKKLLSIGESPRNEKLDPAELAAWSTVASVILNMDETISKE